MRIFFAVLASVLLLAGCASEKQRFPNSAPDAVARAVYRHNGPPELVLFTMVSNETGSGAHTSLLISASQRVAFDPAGSFRDEKIVAANDVIYGMTPALEDVYTRFHARKTYHVIVQRMPVSAEVAEEALRLALAHGRAAPAQCAVSTSGILSKLPGFGAIGGTWYPKVLAERFGKLPGVTTRTLREYDDEDRFKALRDYVPATNG